MSKASGKAEAAPPKEGIELQIEGMMYNVLAAMEKRMMEVIENFVPPAPVAPVVAPPKEKTEEEKRIEAVNRERLAEFRKVKEARLKKNG